MKFILALCALLFAVSAQAATYRYTSAELDSLGGGSEFCDKSISYTCKDDFGQGSRLIVTFEWVDVLPANSLIKVPYSVLTKKGASVMVTGRMYGGFAGVLVELETDGTGDIIGWDIYALPYSSQDYAWAKATPNGTRVEYFYEFLYECTRPQPLCIDFDRRSASTAQAGSWQVISPVPLPASGSVLLAGLGVLILRRRFQRPA